ncbi:hypothetical protein OH76DRAFT_1454733 [Lentinus brumalis]|uniref:Uncharacterized protein n=1 Tax=Lentinus brumalis TaxID=2498619 RepID=A0A371DH03_9APHY|nr:hypothetical protein OH76DRAFT_1454733 [Polyporus brumalis]
MPPPIPAWQLALVEVDRSQPVPPTSEIWPYWIPEPSLVIGSHCLDRQRRYLINWVRARPIWLSLLQLPDHPIPAVNSQGWRVYLNGVPDDPSLGTTTGRRALEIKQVFGAILAGEDIEPAGGGDVRWHGTQFSEVPEALCPWVVWELHELAFRYELVALDRVCCPTTTFEQEVEAEDRIARVFPHQGLWSVTHIPTADESGLFARVPQRRVAALNALRDVVARWPGCPAALLNAKRMTIRDVGAVVELEKIIAHFYVHTFFALAGRPPILPHFLPTTPSSSSAALPVR